MSYLKIRGFARGMRKKPTPAEQAFWVEVRRKRFLGLRFNRQYVLEYVLEDGEKGYYIPDFYCHQYRLIVEIDGGIHYMKRAEDAAREAHLRDMNYQVIRFENEQVLHNMKVVLEDLAEFIEQLK